jgi:hypothetical protein
VTLGFTILAKLIEDLLLDHVVFGTIARLAFWVVSGRLVEVADASQTNLAARIVCTLSV